MLIHDFQPFACILYPHIRCVYGTNGCYGRKKHLVILKFPTMFWCPAPVTSRISFPKTNKYTFKEVYASFTFCKTWRKVKHCKKL